MMPNKESEWDELEIDWDEFPSNARRVVDDPRLWDTAHDFAPHGNDSGFDLFHAFKEGEVINSRDEGKAFYQRIFRSWGVDPNANPGDEDYKYKRLMIIGMAFAYLKLGGYCPEWLATLSLQQLADFNVFIERVDPEWDLKEECYTYYDSCARCIEKSPRALSE